VAVVDATGESARGCPRHAAAALDGIEGACVDWDDSRRAERFERKALEITEELEARGNLGKLGASRRPGGASWIRRLEHYAVAPRGMNVFKSELTRINSADAGGPRLR
jgi:hypothetical protein